MAAIAAVCPLAAIAALCRSAWSVAPERAQRALRGRAVGLLGLSQRDQTLQRGGQRALHVQQLQPAPAAQPLAGVDQRQAALGCGHLGVLCGQASGQAVAHGQGDRCRVGGVDVGFEGCSLSVPKARRTS